MKREAWGRWALLRVAANVFNQGSKAVWYSWLPHSHFQSCFGNKARLKSEGVSEPQNGQRPRQKIKFLRSSSSHFFQGFFCHIAWTFWCSLEHLLSEPCISLIIWCPFVLSSLELTVSLLSASVYCNIYFVAVDLSLLGTPPGQWEFRFRTGHQKTLLVVHG